MNIAAELFYNTKKSADARNAYMHEMARQGADRETLGMLMGDSMKKNVMHPLDVPVYESAIKIPLKDQLEMLRNRIDIDNAALKKNPALGLPPSQEERRQEYLRQLREEELGRGQEYA